VSLKNLTEYDKRTCLERLEKANSNDLWDVFLEIQAELFFDHEMQWMVPQTWWPQAQKILEIGSGNGAYLSRFAARFPEKTFQGIERVPTFVKQSNASFARTNLRFQDGDAEILNLQWVHSVDVVLFRFTLQHLTNSTTALQNAWHYLLAGGYVLIIDSCDVAHRSSYPIIEIEKALQLVEERQREQGQGNRNITLDLLKTLEIGHAPLSKLYKAMFSNLNPDGQILCEPIRFQGKRDRHLGFTQGLLFLKLLNQTYQIPIHLDEAYDQLKLFLKDETAWVCPGIHYLVLRKLK
jgi:ubiquinone/menaquinone biosynthesis C-methylase UbiE